LGYFDVFGESCGRIWPDENDDQKAKEKGGMEVGVRCATYLWAIDDPWAQQSTSADGSAWFCVPDDE
jgi:hypothetical protein